MAGAAVSAGGAAAALLIRDRESIARAVTDALYERHPDLLDKHGARGRQKCLQDMHYNIEHLIPAVDLNDGSMFARYVEWLDNMLRARNVATRDVIACLELTRDECTRRYPESESTAIAGVIAAGLAVLAR